MCTYRQQAPHVHHHHPPLDISMQQALLYGAVKTTQVTLQEAEEMSNSSKSSIIYSFSNGKDTFVQQDILKNCSNHIAAGRGSDSRKSSSKSYIVYGFSDSKDILPDSTRLTTGVTSPPAAYHSSTKKPKASKNPGLDNTKSPKCSELW